MIARGDQIGTCDFCGLPLGPRWRQQPTATRAEQEYCCFGCRFAAELNPVGAGGPLASRTLIRLGLAIFCSMNVMVFTMALWTRDFYGAASVETARMSVVLDELLRYLCLLTALPVLVMLGGAVTAGAWRDVRRGAPSTDALVLAGVLASYVYSVVSVFRGDGHVYFEVGCLVLVVLTIGRLLEAKCKQSTTAALDELDRLLPERVRVLRDGCDTWLLADEVSVGDLVHVLPGERFPVDGALVGRPAHVRHWGGVRRGDGRGA